MAIEISTFLKKPLKIGNRRITNRLALAPMAGIGHIAFRELVASFSGHGILFTEMASAKSVPHENRYVSPVFRWRDEELAYLVCQIFGSEPETMAEAAKRIEDEGFFGVDINFGCSVSAICKMNCGAALLKNPSLAVSIVSSVRDAVSIPLFVKFRTGWKDDPGFSKDMAIRFEEAGADALTFHPRVAPDRRSRPPKWEYIGIVKDSVSIPVFGNGNVFSPEDCSKMILETGCDGVSIGRGAAAKPWIFSEFTEGFSPDAETYRNTMEKMAELLEKYYEPTRAIKHFKKFALYFSAGFKYSHSIYKKLCRGNNLADIRKNIEDVFSRPQEVSKRPNMNMFVA